MEKALEKDPFGHELFRAGQTVPAGRYKQIDSVHIVELVCEDILPAGFDGHATWYTLFQTWSDLHPANAPSDPLESGLQ